MEAFIAYNEYFLSLTENKPTFQELILTPIQQVKNDLIQNKVLQPRRLEESFTEQEKTTLSTKSNMSEIQ